MTDKVQKIREKVEIVVNRRLNLLNGDCFDLDEETEGFTNEIMDIIDSMQEEPVSEDWETAAIQFATDTKTGKVDVVKQSSFFWGVIYHNQQLMAKAVDAVVKIDAGGYPYIDRTIELYDYDKDIPLAKEGDKYKVILIKEGWV